jgi:nicotinate phosphoribosyltransferase
MTYSDVYFTKTKNALPDDQEIIATYGVFMRHPCIAAISPAIRFLKEYGILKESGLGAIKILRHVSEGDLVSPETPLFSYQGNMKDIVELETQMLQRVGFSCISAYNAYMMSIACPSVSFLDMAARHCAPDDGNEGMVYSCAYGASVGSRSAQFNHGANGFVGSSLDRTALLYGSEKGMGTMPHVLVGLAGSTVDAMEMFINGNPNDQSVVVLVDYFGKEYTDALECADRFKQKYNNSGKTLGVRLDTHGGRYAEGLDFELSVDIVSEWCDRLDCSKWYNNQHWWGEERPEKTVNILHGPGVSVANIVKMRNTLDKNGHQDVKIIASSGFNTFKCTVMGKVEAPIDMIGTGSFLPEIMSQTYATADCVMINGVPRVKVGREFLMNSVVPHWE